MNIFFKSVPEHIYIHLPFCAKRCHYCDFIALVAHEDFIRPYHEALLIELRLFAQKFEDSKNVKIKTIFFGGGTPSLYPSNFLEDIFNTLHKYYDLSQIQEVTIEANPVDITPAKLALWKSFGINRLSIGIQVLDDDVLHMLNRPQKVSDVLRAMGVVSNYFENVSIDLILGLPGVSGFKWESTLQTVSKWPITHISVYMLTVYEKTPMFFKLEKGELGLVSDEFLAMAYESTCQFLQACGFMKYEISNFAKNGYESIHNTSYWERRPYYGFGLSASSFDGKNRYTNQKNIEKYIQLAVIEHELPIEFFESLTAKQEAMEALMLGLRTKKGVGLQSVLYLFTDFQKDKFLNNVNHLVDEHFLMCDGSQIYLTSKGMLFENKVVLDLIEGLF